MRRDFTPDSARAALPGTTGCKREDPLRHQCSEHLAVRSRAGRDDAQTAREAWSRTAPAGTALAPSVGRHRGRPSPSEIRLNVTEIVTSVNGIVTTVSCPAQAGVEIANAA